MFKVIVKNERPEFRVFVDLLFGPDCNVDSEGDSNPVNSRIWRDLYLKDRAVENSDIEIYAEEGEPLQFEIESKFSNLEELASIYLFTYCGDSIFEGNEKLSSDDIANLKKKHEGKSGSVLFKSDSNIIALVGRPANIEESFSIFCLINTDPSFKWAMDL